MSAQRALRRTLSRCLVPFAVLAVACTDTEPTAPELRVQFARGTAGPTVKSTDPSSALRFTTLNVHVIGTAFEPGSRAVWALKGDTSIAITKVKTNGTTFVSSTELIASITIDDASLTLYDVVVVTPQGKKGIGIELFAVTSQTISAIAPKGVDGEADAINDVGQVVGLTGEPLGSTPRRAYLWTPTEPRGATGVFRYIDGGSASSLNNAGQVVGGLIAADGQTHAAFWSLAHGWQDLGVLPAGVSSVAKDISENGIVAGIGDSVGDQRAIVWSLTLTADGAVTSSTPTNLGTIPGGGGTVAFAIDPTGTYVVGWLHRTPSEGNRPAVWTRSAGVWTIRELQVLAGDSFGTAYGVDSRGNAVGISFPPQGCRRAVMWATDGTVRALPNFADGCYAEAYAINDAGQIVGRADSRRVGTRAVMWTVGPAGIDGPQDLGALPGANSANAVTISANINGLVQAAGYQISTKGLMTPVLWSKR
jgi:uncharacterized membrane protein